jgi:hypothetical protein
VCDDAIYVCSCINKALGTEIQWPDADRRRFLAQMEPRFPGAIGVIDETLCKINRPYTANMSFADRRKYGRYFNGRKKIYAFNNTIVVDHEGFIIYIDPGYVGSAHDVTILKESSLHQNWRNHFTRTQNSFEYLLGDRTFFI